MRIFIASVLAIGLGACGNDALNGKWVQNNGSFALSGGGTVNFNATMTFTQTNNSFDLVLALSNGLSDTIEATGTYKDTGSTVTLTITGFQPPAGSGDTTSKNTDGAQCVKLAPNGGFLFCLQSPQTNTYTVTNTLSTSLQNEIPNQSGTLQAATPIQLQLTSSHPLQTVPSILDLGAVPLPATFAGRLQRLQHAADHGRLWRAAHHKRWYYAGAASGDHYVGAAVVHLGYAAKAFVYVLDRVEKKFLLRQSALVPAGPWLLFSRHDDGAAEAAVRTPWLTVAFNRTAAGDATVSAHGKGFGLRLFLEPSHSFVAAAKLAGGDTSATEKTLVMRARGQIAGDRPIAIDGFGGLDLTDGYLPRETRWRWASFNTEKVGLNVVQDWLGAAECVAWVGKKLVALGEARIDFDVRDPERPWQVTTHSGQVDLTFTPLAMHREKQNIGIAQANFIQPAGVFSGQVCGEKIENALGVAEEQDVIW